MTKDSVVKIGDLGVAKITEDTIHANSMAGTRIYMSPQILSFQDYTDKTDVWFVTIFFCIVFIKI